MKHKFLSLLLLITITTSTMAMGEFDSTDMNEDFTYTILIAFKDSLKEMTDEQIQEQYKNSEALPLIIPIIKNDYEEFKKIIQQKWNGDIANIKNEEDRFEPLTIGTLLGHHKIVKYILKNTDLNLLENKQDDAEGYLAVSIVGENPQIVKMVLKSGIDVNNQTYNPLKLAMKTGNEEIIKILKSEGAKTSKSDSEKNKSDIFTALINSIGNDSSQTSESDSKEAEINTLNTLIKTIDVNPSLRVKKQQDIRNVLRKMRTLSPRNREDLAILAEAEMWSQGTDGKISYTADLNNIDTSNISNMKRLFGKEREEEFSFDSESKSVHMFKFKGNISGWDVSNVTNMSNMFENNKSFNGNISNWNTSNTINMASMFMNARSFNGDLSKWDVSNVTNMSRMFSKAHSFNGDLSKWNVSNVTNMSYMFQDTRSFNGDLSNWDVSNVTNMSYMFQDTRAFNSDLSKWDVSNVTNMSAMFKDAHTFNGDLSKWNVINVTHMRFMFYDAYLFNGNISNWNTSNVTNMNYMFAGAKAFKQNLSGWDVDDVYEMDNVFTGSGLDNSEPKWCERNYSCSGW